MACARCGFHNLPGTAVCVSCQVPLLAAAPISLAEITPPRASPLDKLIGARLRGWLRRHALTSSHFSPLQGLVPGLPQLRRGRGRWAAGFFGGWLLCMLLAFHFFGSSPCMFYLGLALACHVISALLPYLEPLRGMSAGQRVCCCLAAYAGLLVCIYLPLRLAVGHFVVPVGVRQTLGKLQKGDVLLIRRNRDANWRPSYGTLVATSLWQQEVMLDRIIGKPGDTLGIRDGVLYRNNQPVPPAEAPLDPRRLPRKMRITVPAGYYFVWPSLAILNIAEITDGQISQIGLVSQDQLLGEPWMIYHPLSRRRFIERDGRR